MATGTVLAMPPLELIQHLSGSDTEASYRDIGVLFRRLLCHPGGLKPTDRVLEVGSGIGRMAQAIGDYVVPPGSYDGIEIAPPGVDWCTANVTTQWPHFRFRHADLYNSMYNPNGPVRARRYRFPFADASFDFVFLTSVFTHLLPPDAAHYLDEVARVLKPGGRLFATFFLISADRVDGIRRGDGVGLFRDLHRYDKPQLPAGEPPAYGDCFFANPAVPEGAVGYDPRWLADHLRGCGLTPDATTYLGTWDGRPSEWDGQDVVCATKTGTPAFGHTLKKAMRLDGLREWVWRRKKR